MLNMKLEIQPLDQKSVPEPSVQVTPHMALQEYIYNIKEESSYPLSCCFFSKTFSPNRALILE